MQRRAARLVAWKPFWILSLGVLFLLPLGRALAVGIPKPPAMKLPLPAFELTDQHGARYGSEELRGHVWVADFVFTS